MMLQTAAFIIKLPFYLIAATCALLALACVVYIGLINAFIDDDGKPPRRPGQV